MSETKSGGPAFPVSCMNDTAEPVEGFSHDTVPPYKTAYYRGISVRDYFAAKAMQGVFDNPIPSSLAEKEYIAKHAYAMADAMLKAREQ